MVYTYNFEFDRNGWLPLPESSHHQAENPMRPFEIVIVTMQLEAGEARQVTRNEGSSD